MRRGTAILKELDHWENEIVKELEHNPNFENIIIERIVRYVLERIGRIDDFSESNVEIIRINALLRLRNLHAGTY